jgi:hypothetical protein
MERARQGLFNYSGLWPVYYPIQLDSSPFAAFGNLDVRRRKPEISDERLDPLKDKTDYRSKPARGSKRITKVRERVQ